MPEPEVVIDAAHLGKRYRLGQREAYATLRDTLAQSWTALWSGRRRAAKRTEAEILWALQDVSFQIRQGEVVGIIGANGAGKSTLLKILSRITHPTEGRVRIRGRVSSLLEVGTGFHAELTGRENIFLNGAILGMGRREIARKFDDMVAFAEVERFIDTPVKRYSSGMYLRLAFAVAAHLEPDILLVDEVLAVGDAVFQKKCLGKMSEVATQGRTILFVSHNMAAMNALTQRCLWLHGGRIIEHGPTQDVTAQYLASSAARDLSGVVDLATRIRRRHAPHLEAVSLVMSDARGESRGQFHEGDPIQLQLIFDVKRPVQQLDVSLSVSAMGQRLFTITTGRRVWEVGPGRYTVATTLDPNPLRPGVYQLSLGLSSSVWQDGGYDVAAFEVVDNPYLREPRYPTHGNFGVLYLPYAWGECALVRPMADAAPAPSAVGAAAQ